MLDEVRTTELMVLTKAQGSYATADMAGPWNFVSLAAGLDEPWWSRGTLTVAANGAVSGTLNDSNGSPHPASGILTITADGVVTRSGDPDFRCAMDAGKTVLVCTTSW